MTAPELSPPALVTFQRIQAITCRGNLRIRVLADGTLFTQVERGNCTRGEDWSGPWPTSATRRLSEAERRALIGLIESPAFLALPACISTPGRDGYRDEIAVALGPHRHQVSVERAPPPPAFAILRDHLLQLAASQLEGDPALPST